MLMLALVLVIIVLVGILVLINQKIQRLQKELEEMRNQLKIYEINEKKGIEVYNKLLSTINAIHLYASLTEEEAKIQSVKDKQKKIMDICETVIKECR